MSMDYNDVWEFGAVSDCCGAGVYLNGICSNCNDHCTPEEECPNCGGLVQWDCTCILKKEEE